MRTDNESSKQEHPSHSAVRSAIAGQLVENRKRQQLSQRTLSSLSGIPQKTISRLENGQDLPKLPTLAALAHAAGYKV